MRPILLILMFVLVMFGRISAEAKPTKDSNASKSASSSSEQSKKELTNLLISLQKSVREADAQTLSSLWSDDAIFIDETGEEIHGSAALRQRFDALFQARKDQPKSAEVIELQFEPTTVSLHRIMSPSLLEQLARLDLLEKFLLPDSR